MRPRWTTLGTTGALLATAHSVVNARRLLAPPADPEPSRERVAVLLPLRDEAHRVEPCLRALLGQQRVPTLELLVLDDGSSDGTAQVVRRIAAGDPRLRLLPGAPLPAGWLGKPHACAQLAEAARADVLVFVDADVVLAPLAVAASVALLREQGLDLASPYPRQRAESVAERLVQPLLQWSWLTFLPLGLAVASPWPALAAANGQLLVVDAAVYLRVGGHTGVRREVVEDVALLRAIKRAGGRGVVVDGTALATCRMYAGAGELRAGYTKSLSAALGPGSLAVLALLYLVPPMAALRGSRPGLVGYAAGVAGRVITARRTGGRSWPDALAHPLSVAALLALTADSYRLRRRGALTWKGRALP